MSIRQFVRALAPIASLAVAALLAGCDDANVSINGEQGKPLAEIDLTGAAPTALVLMGPDEVRIRQGDSLSITVDGAKDLADAMRFTLKDGSLGILRRNGAWKDGGTVVVNVTMPAPAELVAAGSGTIRAESLARAAKVTIAGSGDVETMNVAADALDVTIAGSGNYRAAGTAAKLEMTIAGSGNAAMDALKTDSAHISIAGSGRSAFSSDGAVKADILGSGEVRVRGRARCEVKAAGSGKLVCEADAQAAAQARPGPRRKAARA